MLFGKFISLFVIAAILNPICCCNAELVADTNPTPGQHDCCDMGEANGQKASRNQDKTPCEGEDKCPLKPDSVSQKAQHPDAKSPAPQDPPDSEFLGTLFGSDPSAELAKATSANPGSARQGRSESQERVRLHQAKCVYLI